jgi:SAM-dependent methyltransferase
MIYVDERRCRSCGGERLTPALDLGLAPLADRLLTAEMLDTGDLAAPLTLVVCSDCALAQIRETVDPTVLFCNDYPYFSSVSKSLLEHFGASAAAILRERKLGAQSLVVEAASNDGYMLADFKAAGCRVLGIDPASGPVAAARARGIETLETFFTKDLAADLRTREPAGAAVFLANNVLAHVPDLNGFVAGIRAVLADDGVAVIECPYVVDLVDHCEFDTIYHQHLCYFSVTALDRLFARHGLSLNRVDRTAIHGGSLRLFVEPRPTARPTVERLLALEQERGFDRLDAYTNFASRVMNVRTALRALLSDLKADGASIGGYGAAAKGTTMLAYCGIGRETLDFVADKNTFKQGKFLGGNHLPIVPASALLERQPDYVLILAWNFAAEIMHEQAEYARRGGRFVVPIPEPKVV